MKKKLFILCAALVWTVALMAQSIAVVTANGTTTLVRTLDEAIAVANENPGCVVYLPGGGFPVSDDSKITKKVTIIGIGHKANNDNVDGVTTISGNIYFNEGSDGSALMGCYLTGYARIGHDGSTVNDILIRYCNLSGIWVHTIGYGTIVNQNYVSDCIFGDGSAIEITNNVCKRISSIDGGLVSNNIITQTENNIYDNPLHKVNNSLVSNNVFLHNERSSTLNDCNYDTFKKNLVFKNMFGATDEELISLSGILWSDVFVKPDGANSTSDYHFKEAYKQYESKVGIYAGDGFNDTQIAPVPYIVAKRIDEQTDASGKLNVKIRVKAGGE